MAKITDDFSYQNLDLQVDNQYDIEDLEHDLVIMEEIFWGLIPHNEEDDDRINQVHNENFDILQYVTNGLVNDDYAINTFIEFVRHILRRSLNLLGMGLRRNELNGTFYLSFIINRLIDEEPQYNSFSMLAFYNSSCDAIRRVLLFISNRNSEERSLIFDAEKLLNHGISHHLNKLTQVLSIIKSGLSQNLYRISHAIHSHRIANQKLVQGPLTPLLETGIEYADLAYGAGQPPYNKDLVAYHHESFYVDGILSYSCGLNGICGIDQTNSLVLAFKGTSINRYRDLVTDFWQAVMGSNDMYRCALGLSHDLLLNSGYNLHIYGHSLGGGLTQFCIAGLNTQKNDVKGDLQGYGYNSAGLSMITFRELRNPSQNLPRMHHLYISPDIIFPTSGFQLGDCHTEISGINVLTAHTVDGIRNTINNHYRCRLVR